MVTEGVYAALLTPSCEDAQRGFDRLVDCLAASGVAGLCVGGATGEYLAYGVEERSAFFRQVGEHCGGRLPFIAGIGAERSAQSLQLAEAAAREGASAVLLPSPSYFQYDADDLVEFIDRTARHCPLPVLLYHIPQFNRDPGLEKLLRLVETVPNIIGIKDSSGSREGLALIGPAKKRFPMKFFCGSDDLLLDALAAGADGAISGIATACPELVAALYRESTRQRERQTSFLQGLVNEFAVAIGKFPVPWGIRWAAEARGFDLGPVNWPLSETRKREAQAFRRWFEPWWLNCTQALTRPKEEPISPAR